MRPIDRIVCASPSPTGVSLRGQVRLDHRRQHQQRRRLRHPVPQARNPQCPILPALLPPNDRRIGLRIIGFEACSAFTRVTARMVAESPLATRLIAVLQSMSLPSSTAPTATGWSDLRPPLGSAFPMAGIQPRLQLLRRMVEVHQRRALRRQRIEIAPVVVRPVGYSPRTQLHRRHRTRPCRYSVDALPPHPPHSCTSRGCAAHGGSAAPPSRHTAGPRRDVPASLPPPRARLRQTARATRAPSPRSPHRSPGALARR